MEELLLTRSTIEKAGKEAINALRIAMADELVKVVLYGSCARGDFNSDSDLDIALITKCDRVKAKKYVDILAEISSKLAMKYFIVVNFVAIPEWEFQEKKGWYQYFKNIESDGIVLYG
ncbi:MAG: nucleotidyltransferase domain-containing protein [Clostridiales bacterium]|nr:nucleotidyltransferase domain-containing protein [Clostridiales bacterium]